MDVSSRQKTSEQVLFIEEVQRAAEKAMEEVISYFRSSKNPNSEEAHAIIDRVLEQAGCESPEGHIVAGGIQSAAPHEKGGGLLKRDEPIVIDIYPRSRTSGYFADMTRTVCLAKPAVQLQKMFDAVLGAQELAISMIKPGVQCQKIQEAVENFFSEAGFLTSGKVDKKGEFPFTEGFVHSVGHGVGQSIHEAPRIGRKSSDVLMEGDVLAIEPGLYYKAIGGVRIEDMLLVTNNGFRNLTNFSKEYIL